MLTPHSPLKCTACDSRRGYAMGLSVVTRADWPGLTLPKSGSFTYTRTHFGRVIANAYTGFCGVAMSPGSSRRERTTASDGAINWP